jgi:hypothetical protein
METHDFIIEIGSYQMKKHGKEVCGDTFLSRKVKGENRYVAVLSDGLGSGIKANVLSTLTATMALNFRLMHEPVINSARWVMDTLPFDSDRNISYSTFTIVDVDFEGYTTVIEYGNPAYFIERNGEIIRPPRTRMEVMQSSQVKNIEVSNFNLLENDRLVMVSDGITQSGIGNATMPFGWGNQNLCDFVLGKNSADHQLSATELAKAIVKKAEMNDVYRLKDDTSCAIIYRRRPRKLLICSGPPFNDSKDKYLARQLADYDGTKVVCGGTTARIISREWHEDIQVGSLAQMNSGLPPVSTIRGVDLVTEGVLTLSKVSEDLESLSNCEILSDGPDARIVRLLLNADIIEFMVGTSVNLAHQDPDLPFELDIRRNIIKRIVSILEDKFLKKVNIQYL